MEAPRSRRMVGSAVETTCTSREIINDATDVSARTQRLVAFSLLSFINSLFSTSIKGTARWSNPGVFETRPSSQQVSRRTDQAQLDRRGGWHFRMTCSAKLHLRVEGKGKPTTCVLTAGQRHETTKFEVLMEQGAVKRVGRGHPRRILGDKAYSNRKIHHNLKHREIGSTIPRRSDETRTGPFNRALYKERKDARMCD